MIVLEQQTWVTILGFAGFAVTLLGYLANFKREMKADFAGLRTEFKTDMVGLRTELKTDMADLRTELKTDMADLRTDLKTDIAGLRTDISKVDARLISLENRTYDISTRLPAAKSVAS